MRVVYSLTVESHATERETQEGLRFDTAHPIPEDLFHVRVLPTSRRCVVEQRLSWRCVALDAICVVEVATLRQDSRAVRK
jgi:hypothetical protein